MIKLLKVAVFEFTSERVGDVKHSLANISLARDLIDYEPDVSFEEGLRKTFDYLRRRTKKGGDHDSFLMLLRGTLLSVNSKLIVMK